MFLSAPPLWRTLSRTARAGLDPSRAWSCKFSASRAAVVPHRRISMTTTYGSRLFTDKHEWIVLEGKVGTVGISDYAQKTLGDIVFVQLPSPGDEFHQLDECGALESVKAASELYSPVSGKVTEKNEKVEQSPGLINSSCYDDGWLFKIEITDKAELGELMNEDKYNKFIESAEE